MNGGQVACTESLCQVIDYDSLLGLSGNSSLHVFGGSIQGPITLSDNSTAHFFGNGLTLTINPTGGIVTGKLASGEEAFFSISSGADATSHIFLHEVPEPPIAVIGSLVFAAALSAHRVRSKSFAI
jgi:hypothetical protein